MRAKGTRGFTLIELLVVIAIIATLIAILLPSLGRVRAKANTARCLSTVRGLGFATQIYLSEWQKMFPLTFQVPNAAWNQLLRNTGDTGGGSYGLTLKARICPEALTANEINRDTALNDSWFGTAHNAWGNSFDTGNDPETGRPLIASYGINAYVYNPTNPNTMYGISSSSMFSLPVKFDETRIPLFVDCTWRHLAPTPTDTPGANLDDPGVYSFTAPMPLSYAMINRHNKAVNVVFADSHAETVKLLDLYHLKWSKTWKDPVTLPTLPPH